MKETLEGLQHRAALGLDTENARELVAYARRHGLGLEEVVMSDIKDTIRERIWWLIHNCVAHPWIGMCPRSRRANAFHDWTARRM